MAGVINSGNDATDNTVAFSNGLLEGTWRTYKGQRYLFVLNMSSATLTGLPFSTSGLTGLSQMSVYGESRLEPVTQGLMTDSFAPYQLHVYSTSGQLVGSGGPVVVGSPVPEPTGARNRGGEGREEGRGSLPGSSGLPGS